MSDAYCLLTAMPPTKGHLHLIQFASSLATHAHVILCTQPDEPLWQERLLALKKATQGLPNVLLHHIHKTLPQEPEQDPGFWDMWADFLHMFGFQKGDYVVASEYYGLRLAEEVEGVFMPYDINRSITPGKATDVRKYPQGLFEFILPEFQPYLRKTVTIFGAESTGKTTLSSLLAKKTGSHWLPEWARPYLETVGAELTAWKMERIAKGQTALQRQGQMLTNKPFVIQDTDLYSTIGYWNLHQRDFGFKPYNLEENAGKLMSDLYVITPSNIPFETDPLRYGGNKREGSDEFWVNLLEKYFGAKYVILSSDHLVNRVEEARAHLDELYKDVLSYDRITKQTLGV